MKPITDKADKSKLQMHLNIHNSKNLIQLSIKEEKKVKCTT